VRGGSVPAGGGECSGEVVEPVVDLLGGVVAGVVSGAGGGSDVAGKEMVIEIGWGEVVEEVGRVPGAVVDGGG
jgi:hypothetical protein